jgi:di/tricarboxylate transporter
MIILILGMFILFITEILAIDVIALLVLSILMLSGFVTPIEGLSGFSNPAVITIAALFVISFALQKSGVLEYIILYLNKIVGRNKYLGLIFYLVSIAIASAIVNNTAVVAIFIPITIRLAEKYNISPSKVLIPLSYAAILGGTMTLIGTSTNLLVNSILIQETNQPALGMFEFSKFGVIKLTVGLIYMLLVGIRMLPSRTVTSSLTKSYHMGGFLTEVKILNDSPMVGKTCLERGINKNYDVMVLEISRGGKFITTNIRNTVLQEEDVLIIRGSLENFVRLKEIEKVALLTDEKIDQKELEQEDNILVECLITDKGSLVGKTVYEINFRRRFGGFILAIRREGAILRRKIAHILIKPFDTLLVFGAREKIIEMIRTGDFIILQEMQTALKKQRFWFISIMVIIAIVSLAAFGILPISTGALFGVVLLLIFRLITPNEAYQSIHWQVIILIAALIPLAYAIQSSGTADWLGQSLFMFIGKFDPSIQPIIFLALTYLLTMILTEVSSNAATAIIMTPIILATSEQMNLDPRPFIFAICFAASASFITPVGYQTNLMVYGPGGYKFTDYIKVGLPLGIILWILAVIFIPIFWPFQ